MSNLVNPEDSDPMAQTNDDSIAPAIARVHQGASEYVCRGEA